MVYTPGDFDRNHLQLTWGGWLPGNESWSCSIKLANAVNEAILNDTYLDGIDLQDAIDGYLKDAVLAFHTDPRTLISGACYLDFAKVALIGRQGLYPPDQNAHEHVFAHIAGGGSGAIPPNQIALAVSLTTGFTRGAAHRGRFYLPATTTPLVGTTGLISDAAADGVAAAAKAFVEAISDVPGLDTPYSPGAVVMSRKSGQARTRQVTGIAVGKVIDTQRRRRRSLPESYHTIAVDQGIA
jgi:hypothetical protein